LEVPLLTGRAKPREAPGLSIAWATMTDAAPAACLADRPAPRLMLARSRANGIAESVADAAFANSGTFTLARPPDNTGPDGLAASGGSTMEQSNPWRNVQ
jgi:hypothetical protein